MRKSSSQLDRTSLTREDLETLARTMQDLANRCRRVHEDMATLELTALNPRFAKNLKTNMKRLGRFADELEQTYRRAIGAVDLPALIDQRIAKSQEEIAAARAAASRKTTAKRGDV